MNVAFLLRHSALRRLAGAALRLLRRASPDDRTFLSRVARIGLGSYPRARRHLEHYLSGAGGELRMDAAGLLADNPGMAGFAARRVMAETRAGCPRGALPVPQWRMSSMDWRLALGSIVLEWERRRDAVRIGYRGAYDWRPADDRWTRPAHEAAEQLKNTGARAFALVGDPALVPMETLRSLARVVAQPSDRLYM